MNASDFGAENWIPAAVPAPDEVSADFWGATERGVLTVQRCGSCDHHQHPPRAVCTQCSSMDHLSQVEAQGTGIVDAFTTIHRPPRPDLTTPYTIARVRLDEGPLLLTRLEPADGWATGDAVVVAFKELPDGRALPFFRSKRRSSDEV